MAVFLTGDTHNTTDIGKIVDFDAQGLTRDDYLVILGDLGFVWTPAVAGDVQLEAARAEDERWLDWLEARPYTTLWIDGNHENFDLLEAYPEEEWCGGRIQRIREHVIHLMRSEIFFIDGKTFFSMGGSAFNR